MIVHDCLFLPHLSSSVRIRQFLFSLKGIMLMDKHFATAAMTLLISGDKASTLATSKKLKSVTTETARTKSSIERKKVWVFLKLAY